MSWQPIETAPKDGTYILVFPPTFSNTASCARWNKDTYSKNPRPYWSRTDTSGRINVSRDNPPTHWMPVPLPLLPEDQG